MGRLQRGLFVCGISFVALVELLTQTKTPSIEPPAVDHLSCFVPPVIPPLELRKGNRNTMADAQYIESASDLVSSVSWLVGTAKASNMAHMSTYSLDRKVIMDYGCGAGRFLVGLHSLGVCNFDYIGVDVGQAEIDWLRQTHQNNNKYRFSRVNVQNDRYNQKGQVLSDRIFSKAESNFWNGTVDLLVLRSVFSHMESSDIAHHLVALREVLKSDGIMVVSLFVRPQTDQTVLSDEKIDQKLHMVVLSKESFEAMVHQAGYHVLLYTTQMGQDTYVLGVGVQPEPSSAARFESSPH